MTLGTVPEAGKDRRSEARVPRRTNPGPPRTALRRSHSTRRRDRPRLTDLRRMPHSSAASALHRTGRIFRHPPLARARSRHPPACRLVYRTCRIAGVGYSDTYALPSIFIRGTAPISARRCQASVQGSRSIDLAWSAIARDEPCAACRNTRSGLPGRIRYLSLRSAPAGFRARYDPVNGADGDARQGHRFVGAAARGRTTWARAAAQAPGQCMRNPERPARPRSGCADRKAEWRGGADGIAAQRHRGDGGRERAGRA